MITVNLKSVRYIDYLLSVSIIVDGKLDRIDSPTMEIGFTDAKFDMVEYLKSRYGVKKIASIKEEVAQANIKDWTIVEKVKESPRTFVIRTSTMFNPMYREYRWIRFKSLRDSDSNMIRDVEIYAEDSSYARLDNTYNLMCSLIDLGWDYSGSYKEFDDKSYTLSIHFTYQEGKIPVKLYVDGYKLYVELPWSHPGYQSMSQYSLTEYRHDMNKIVDLIQGLTSGKVHEYEVKVRGERSYYTAKKGLSSDFNSFIGEFKDSIRSSASNASTVEIYEDGKMIEENCDWRKWYEE